MKLEIYQKQEKTKKPILLELVKDEGDIRLDIVDKHGEWKNTILKINHNGSLFLYRGISRDHGLKLDVDCRIIIEN